MVCERLNLIQPILGKITQGSIFCCASASRYKEKPVLGLTITARCDVAQDKYPVLNFLPVVRLPDWLLEDGLDILLENVINEQKQHIKSTLKQANLSPSLAFAIPLIDVAKQHFPLGVGSKSERSAADRFNSLVNEIDTFHKIIKEGSKINQLNWLRENKSHKIRDLIQGLSKHSVPGYYLLERLFDDDNTGHVCLLREVSTLPQIVSEEIAKGLSAERYRNFQNINIRDILSFEFENFAMPLIQVGSPAIEHILQTFSNLFCRIGIVEPVYETIEHLIQTSLDGKENA